MSGLARWSPSCNEPPEVAIGVVLPEDGFERLVTHLPDTAYYLRGEGEQQTVESAGLVFGLKGGGVQFELDGQPGRFAEMWDLIPRTPPIDLASPGVRIKGIVAGRGFHWQKKIDQLLPGRISVRVVDGRLQVINHLPLETYLAGVITSEMSGHCPIGLLKSQCIVARSWSLAYAEKKHQKLGVDFCNDDCCQRFQGVGEMSNSAKQAVNQTRGLALVASDGAVVDANYSKSCGGIVEAPEYIWGSPKAGLTNLVDAPAASRLHDFLPIDDANWAAFRELGTKAECDAYCSPRSVPENDIAKYLGRVDRGGGFFRWTVSHDREALFALLMQKECLSADAEELLDLQVTKRAPSGRVIGLEVHFRSRDSQPRAVAVVGEYRIRQVLSESFLFSSAFSVRRDLDTDDRVVRFHLDGAGWGHGAGLCQIGALGMALAGKDHTEILQHYFPTAQLSRMYA